MKPSMIVYGVKGGKTRFAERIAEFYGLDLIQNEFRGDSGILSFDCIYFKRETKKPAGLYSQHAKSFEEVAKEINAAIPLTDWQSGPPPCIGEWVASIYGNDDSYRRYWNGNQWSFAYKEDESLYDKKTKQSRRTGAAISCIEWRGLSQEPINTEE